MQENNGYSKWAWLPDGTGFLIARSNSICTHLLKDGGEPSSCISINIKPTYPWMILAVLFGISVMFLYLIKKPVIISTSAALPLGIIGGLLAGGLVLFELLERVYGFWFPFTIDVDASFSKYTLLYRSSWQDGLKQAIILLPIIVCIIFRLVKTHTNMPSETWEMWRGFSIATLVIGGLTFFFVIVQGGA